MIDSHAHLDAPQFDQDRAQLIAAFPQQGLEAVINVGAEPAKNEAICQLSEKHERIYAALGVHPHDANAVNDQLIEGLRQLIRRYPKVVAIGETGLDYFKASTSKEEQKTAFLKQAALAQEFELPLLVHCRDAFADMLVLLDQMKLKKVLFHCYTGPVEIAQQALARGIYLSFSGIVTFPNAKELQAVAKIVPAERLLLETDCPFLAPQAVRGQRNEPSFIRHTAEFLAELRGVSFAKLDEQTSKTSKEFFGLN